MIAPSSIDPLADYLPIDDVHDELLSADGAVRAHWAQLRSDYRSIGRVELSRRHDEIRRLLEQDGVTYNVADDTARPSRPWKLDSIPFVLDGDEWRHIERGMIQRAEVLDLVLSDLYGERRLLRSGLVPPAMILSDPQFLRACDGITLPGPKQVVVAATDLARHADGSWRALSHRAQAPSGAAYALENRRVLSRVFPQMFQSAGVRSLAQFVQALRSALLAAAPVGVDDPSIVILSPGSLSETAFEHASIAAQLGYPLVQGSDFELRNGLVGLRTVGGWTPVHVVLRRVDAEFCDPLALRSDSTLGVPGLVDACRAGTISVVNTLGSGIVENAGLAGLMPALTKHFLDSDLILDSPESWWCGDAAGRSHVLANLGNLVVRPLSRVTLQQSVDTAHASASVLDGLRRRIEARPDGWVGQERVDPASTPVLTRSGVVPRATLLRSFVVAADDSYVAMPGGLARTAVIDDVPITNRAGASSKDVWVIGLDADLDVETTPTVHERGPYAPVGVLPARAAEHLFWLGRYAERAEATIRLIRMIVTRRDEFLNTSTGLGPASLTVMLEALTRITGTFPGFVGDDADVLLDDPSDELFSLVVDDRRPGSVAHAVRHMFAALDVVRDQLSLDTWLVVGSLQRELERLQRDGADVADADADADGDGDADDSDSDSDSDGVAVGADRDEAMATVLNELLQGLLSLSGLTNESMVRDLGWHFMEAGRRIERSIHVAMLVGSTLSSERSAPVEQIVVESVLVAGESIITSRRRYRTHAVASTTIELLFGDAGNPRSLRFQVDRLAESIAILDADRPPGSRSAAAGILGGLEVAMAEIDLARLADVNEVGHRPGLEQFVATVRSTLSQISNAIGAEAFTRLQPQHRMIGAMHQARDSTRVGTTT